MARKKKHEEHVNHERWLVSYADFITLLFAFFVVMYAISSVNEGKYRVLSDALITAFRTPPKTLDPIQVGDPAKSPATQTRDQRHEPLIVLPPVPRALMPESNRQSNKESTPSPPSSTASGPAAGLLASGVTQTAQKKTANDAAAQARQVDAMQRMAAAIKEAMDPLVKKGHIAVHADNDKIEIELKANILYASGSARLEPQALPVLEKLAEIVRPFPNTVHVEGFTDNQPIRGLLFPSNWELSAARAASVVHVFADNRISPERMAAIGYGEYRPIADNDSEAGRNKNRRVVIVILAHADNQSKNNDDTPSDAPLLAAGEVRGAPVQPEAAPPEPVPPLTAEDQPAAAPLFAPTVEPSTPVPAIQVPRQVPAITPAPAAPPAATVVAPQDSANPTSAPMPFVPPTAAPIGTTDDAPPVPISSAAPSVPIVPAVPPVPRISALPPVQIVPALPPVQIVPAAPATTAPAAAPARLNTTEHGVTEPLAPPAPPVPPAPAPAAAPSALVPPPATSPSPSLPQAHISAPPPARSTPPPARAAPPSVDAAANVPAHKAVVPPIQLPPVNIGISVPPVKVLTDNPSMRTPLRGGGN